MFKMMADPPPTTVVGLSNISNGCAAREPPAHQPHDAGHGHGRRPRQRHRSTRCDEEQNEFIRIVEQRDESTPMGKLVVALYDATAAMEELDPAAVDTDDPAQVDFYKTYRMLQQRGHLRRLVPAHLSARESA